MKCYLAATLFIFLNFSAVCVENNICLTPLGGVLPSWSPNGGQIYFIKENKEGDKYLFCKKLDGIKSKAVNTGNKANSLLITKNHIIYFSGPFFAVKVMKYDPDSKKSTRIKVSSPPNGKAFSYGKNIIAYPSGFGEQKKIALFDIKKNKEIKATNSLPVNIRAISKNKKYAAVSYLTKHGVNNLKVIELSSGKIVSKTPEIVSSGSMEIGGCHSPAFSPDGKFLAYVKADIQPVADIFILDIETGKSIALTSDKMDNQSPVFSPDGSKIAFSSSKGGKYRIWTKTFIKSK